MEKLAQRYNTAINLIQETSADKTVDYNLKSIKSTEDFKIAIEEYTQNCRDAYTDYETTIDGVKTEVNEDLGDMATAAENTANKT
jgi:hypothetical protein